MSTKLPVLERVDQYLATNNIDFLIPPGYFQGEVLILQFISISFLIFIAVKVSKL